MEHIRNDVILSITLDYIIRIYGKHTVHSDGGSWYSEACVSLGLKHRLLHSSYEKSIMVVERTIEYLKDRTEAFDDYFPCIRNGLCSMQHVYKWLILFVFMHNNRISSNPILILLKEVKGVKLTEPASSKDYGCSICDRIFDSIETLNSHKRMDHSQEGY